MSNIEGGNERGSKSLAVKKTSGSLEFDSPELTPSKLVLIIPAARKFFGVRPGSG